VDTSVLVCDADHRPLESSAPQPRRRFPELNDDHRNAVCLDNQMPVAPCNRHDARADHAHWIDEPGNKDAMSARSTRRD